MDENTNSIKQFFDEFNKSKAEDNVQYRSNILSSYNMKPEDVKVEVLDWCLHYLEQKNCPHSLALTLAKLVAHQLSDSVYEMSLQADEGIDDDDKSFFYKTSQLYSEMIECLTEACHNWQEYIDINDAKSEPLPQIVSSCAIKNCRRKMEDRHVILHDLNSVCGLKDIPHHSYYAIFDGHAGIEAASYCAAHLHWNIVNHPAFLSDTEKAISEAIDLTDKNFLERSYREGIKGGCTALCCLIREKTLYVAWLGDSQAVLVKQGIPNVIGLPHKPDREEERRKIEELGGCVLQMDTWRVNGTLAISRALGDIEHKPYISNEAEICKIILDGTEDYIVLACDGLWDKLLPADLGLLVYQHITEGKSIDKVASELVQVSKDFGSTDNITAIVIFLQNPYNISVPPICLPSPLSNESENFQLSTINEENYSSKSNILLPVITNEADMPKKVISSISNIELSVSSKGDSLSIKDENIISNYLQNEYNSSLLTETLDKTLPDNDPSDKITSELKDQIFLNENLLTDKNETYFSENNTENSISDYVSIPLNQSSVITLETNPDTLHIDDIKHPPPMLSNNSILDNDKPILNDYRQTSTDLTTYSDENKKDSKFSETEKLNTSVCINNNNNNNLSMPILGNDTSLSKNENYMEIKNQEISDVIPHSNTETVSEILNNEKYIACSESDKISEFALDTSNNNKQEIIQCCTDNTTYNNEMKNTVQLNINSETNVVNEVDISTNVFPENINNLKNDSTADDVKNSLNTKLQQTTLESTNSSNKIQNDDDKFKSNKENKLLPLKSNETIIPMQSKNLKSVKDSKITVKELHSKSKINNVSAEKLTKTSPRNIQQIKNKQTATSKMIDESPQQLKKDLPQKKSPVQTKINTENVFERLSMPKTSPKPKTTANEGIKHSQSLNIHQIKPSISRTKSGKSSNSPKECNSSSPKTSVKPTKILTPKSPSKPETGNKSSKENVQKTEVIKECKSNTFQEKIVSSQKPKTETNTKCLINEKHLRSNTTEKKLTSNYIKANNRNLNEKISKPNDSINSNSPKRNAKLEKNYVNQKLMEKHTKPTTITRDTVSAMQKNKTVNLSANMSKDTEKRKIKITPEKINRVQTKSKPLDKNKSVINKTIENGNCEPLMKVT